MSERQLHGFLFETIEIEKRNITKWSDYLNKYPNTISDGIYTSTWDAIDENQVGVNFNGRPVQIKCIKLGGSVELGDIFRNANKNENFDLIVGFWKTSKSNIVDIYLVKVDYKKWNNLFTYDKYDEWRDWITNKVSNAYSYDAQWKLECKKYKEDWGISRIIQPKFKRDHKTQRRIQCGISYRNFIKYFIEGELLNE
jgi:hypothetical protein